MKENFKFDESMIGKKVIFTGEYAEFLHKDSPQFYPCAGTVGTIIEYADENDCFVQWPKDTTSKEDCWYVPWDCIEFYQQETTYKNYIEKMTDDEIWDMLQSKLKKNNIRRYMGGIYIGNKMVDGFNVYKQIDVEKAVCLAYRSGYGRCMKGRSFKISEKKKKGGHWEPVDPNNLPKEGTKVRYSRKRKEHDDYENEIVIGDIGEVVFEGFNHNWFGIKLDTPRTCYYNWIPIGKSANCLDMWVEDNE